MAFENKTGLFNLALASLAAGAAAFAVFAMPQDLLQGWIDAVGLPALIDFRIGPAARLSLMAVSASLVSFLSWFALRSCDPPRSQTDIEVLEELDDDWFAQRLAGRSASIEAPAIVPLPAEEDADTPFAELARSAERVDASLELGPENIVDDVAAPDNSDGRADDDGGSLRPEELLVRKGGAKGASGLIQRLNANLADSEWPLRSDEGDEAPTDVDDRLRDALRDLRAMGRGA